MDEVKRMDVDGKQKVVYIKHEVPFTRKGYTLPVDVAKKFSRKCNMLNEPESRMVQRLVEAFNTSSGWGKDTKTGFFFEPRSSEHIKDAIHHVEREFST